MARDDSSSASPNRHIGDALYRGLTRFGAVVVAFVALGIVVALIVGSWPTIVKLDISFLASATWNPVSGEYGALSSIFGTLVSTFIAILIAVPLSLNIALFLVEISPPVISKPVGAAIELR